MSTQCLIKNGESEATGFHNGSGWIVTVVSAVGPDHCHKLLSGARFDFDGQGTVSTPEGNLRRMAYIRRLRAGNAGNVYIAMVKLGIQIDGVEPANWERQEQLKFGNMNVRSIANVGERMVAIRGLLNDGNNEEHAAISELIHCDVKIIPIVQRYIQLGTMKLKKKDSSERQELVKLATRNQLTIYLMDVDVIAGQN